MKFSRIALVAVPLALALALVPAALAGKGTGGGGGGGGKKGGGGTTGGTTYTGSLSLHLLQSTDGLPHWGQQYTFDYTSTATYNFVQVKCSQNGVQIYSELNGFIWPYSGVWMWDWAGGGAADCTAVLEYTDGTNTVQGTLATISFHVYA